MTFSHFSKDLIRHPVSGGESGWWRWISPLILSLRFPQEVFYHLHLPWGEDSLVFTIARTFEGIKEATGIAYLLTKEVYSTLISMVGIVANGQTPKGHFSFSLHMFHSLFSVYW